MRLMRSQIEELRGRVTAQGERIRELEDRSYYGQERQLAQVRASSYRVIADGEDREQQA